MTLRPRLDGSSRASDAEIAAVSRVTAEYIGQLRVQPAAGTLRVVSRLMKPEMLVELELIAAR